MADREHKPIQYVHKNDLVLSYNPLRDKVEVQRVVAINSHRVRGSLLITLSDNRNIETTGNHPFFVNGKGFLQARYLASGMKLRKPDHNVLTITEVKRLYAVKRTYNITVKEYRSYFVGKSEVCVGSYRSWGRTKWSLLHRKITSSSLSKSMKL